MDRRIFGLENEYGVTCTFRGQRRLSPDEVARYLFRRVVHWGRSSNVFLENGARLYLDVGSHPEYATPECDVVREVVAHDKAGERILEGLLAASIVPSAIPRTGRGRPRRSVATRATVAAAAGDEQAATTYSAATPWTAVSRVARSGSAATITVGSPPARDAPARTRGTASGSRASTTGVCRRDSSRAAGLPMSLGISPI